MKLYDELYIYFLASRKAPVRLHREHKGPIELGYVGLDQTDPRLLVGLRKFTQPIRTTLHDARKDMEKSKGILVMRATLEDHNSSQFIIEDVSPWLLRFPDLFLIIDSMIRKSS